MERDLTSKDVGKAKKGSRLEVIQVIQATAEAKV